MLCWSRFSNYVCIWASTPKSWDIYKYPGQWTKGADTYALCVHIMLSVLWRGNIWNIDIARFYFKHVKSGRGGVRSWGVRSGRGRRHSTGGRVDTAGAAAQRHLTRTIASRLRHASGTNWTPHDVAQNRWCVTTSAPETCLSLFQLFLFLSRLFTTFTSPILSFQHPW